jgi:hypothetical protein
MRRTAAVLLVALAVVFAGCSTGGNGVDGNGNTIDVIATPAGDVAIPAGDAGPPARSQESIATAD